MPARTDTTTTSTSSTASNTTARPASGMAADANPPSASRVSTVSTAPSSAAPASAPSTAESVSSDDSTGPQNGGRGLTMRAAKRGTSDGFDRAAERRRQQQDEAQQQPRQQEVQRHQQQQHSWSSSRLNNGRTAPAKPALLRSKSDFVRTSDDNDTAVTHHDGRSDAGADADADDDDEDVTELDHWGARHGFESHYKSEQIAQLANNWYMYFTDKRHESNGKLLQPMRKVEEWRMRDRLKTVSAVIAVCLNIGVEPPDQLRTNPGARLEAWQDTTVPPAHKVLENIGKALVSQYEALAIRPRYKQYLDPSVEETKRFCISLRRNAKDERVLLHYNGHGVPKPTASGEIWVFNKNYTQYIPISLYDMQSWLQAPTIYVWDCSEAGNILTNYERFVVKHEQEENDAKAADPSYEKTNFRPFVHLAACAAKENLPTNPLIPADIFSACLTTPMEMALWFFVQQNPLKTNLTPERARKLPGRLQDRRTPLGELNWIFTAITDTIAWTTLSRDLFRKFFRQDLLVAALFRNFLLAQRIMSVYGCHPQSVPQLPDTRQHPLWASWDLAIDQALDQLPMLEREESEHIDYEYRNSTFFADQLTAFERYLTRGDAIQRKLPEQLPVVLQVLLSQQHRVRALILLGRFLDLGPWAVQLALSIGIFPYVLKLLQSATSELKPVMVFIWTRVLAVDISCQQDLIKDSGYSYFASILRPNEGLPVVNTDEHKAMCAFILAMLCKGYKSGQMVCNQTDIMTSCISHLRNEDNPLLRQWSCLCLSQLWQDLPEAKWRGIRESAPMHLSFLAKDPICEVRCAMLVAMTTLLGIPDVTDEVARVEESVAWTVLDMASDGSPMVRKELVVFMSHFLVRYENKFLVAAYEHLQEEKDYVLLSPADAGAGLGNGVGHKMGLHYVRPADRIREGGYEGSVSFRQRPLPQQQQPKGLSHNTIFTAYWKQLLVLSVDPHPDVQELATAVVDYLHEALLNSPVGVQAQALMEDIQKSHLRFARRSRLAQASQGVVSVLHGHSPRPSMNLTGSTGGAGTDGTSLLGNGRANGSETDGGSTETDGTPPPFPSPGLLRRTVSSLFSPFFGGSDSSNTPGSPLSAASGGRPGSAYSQGGGAPTSPGLLRSGTLSQRSMSRKRGAVGLGVMMAGAPLPPDRTEAPPEDSERETIASPYNVAPEPTSLRAQMEAQANGGSRQLAAPPLAVPLESTYLDWSTEYFREPQMRKVESDEPGSTEYNQRNWRRTRNEGVLRETQPQKAYAGSHKWTNQQGMINNGSQPRCMAFHQFEDHLAVADDGNTVQVWDWRTHELLSRFSNGNPPGSHVSDIKYINEDDQALLMAGSSDGVLRVYRHYESGRAVELASAWRALTDMVPSNVHAGMVFDWQQVTGNVLVAGDVRVVRVWNAGREACVADIPARSGSCVTSLTSDQMTGSVFVAGFGDGALRVFDTRHRPQDAMVRKWKDDTDRVWIKSVHMQRGGQRELVSAARDGKVKVWDIRRDQPLRTIQTTGAGAAGLLTTGAGAGAGSGSGTATAVTSGSAAGPETLRTASVHEHLPIFAVGTAARVVKVFNLDGRELSRTEPYSGFLQSRSTPIAATAFHPHRLMLASAARGDFHVNLYTTSTDRAF